MYFPIRKSFVSVANNRFDDPLRILLASHREIEY